MIILEFDFDLNRKIKITFQQKIQDFIPRDNQEFLRKKKFSAIKMMYQKRYMNFLLNKSQFKIFG